MSPKTTLAFAREPTPSKYPSSKERPHSCEGARETASKEERPLKLLPLALLAIVAVAGCTPVIPITGATHVQNGAAGCRIKCQLQGLDFAGMVLMGDAAEGCVCQERGKSLALQDVAGAAVAVSGQPLKSGAVFAGPGVAPVSAPMAPMAPAPAPF